MNEFEKQFLAKLATEKQGRMGWPWSAHEKALRHLKRIMDEGYVVERKLYSWPGFQITDKGRAYLGGEA